MTRYSSPLPKGVRLTSPFGQRWGVLHAGTDFGPPKPGQPGIPVYAVADGKVTDTGRGDGGPSSDVAAYHSGRAIMIDHGSIGGDRMRTYFGHLAEIHVSVGDRVDAGQQIGVMGGSGPDGEHDFAIHLHFGVCQNTPRPIRAAPRYGARGWIDSHAWLESKGVSVGDDAPVEQKESAVSSGSSASSGSGDDPEGSHVIPVDQLQWRLDRAGYNRVEHLRTRVGAYERQQKFGRPTVNGFWDERDEAHYQWTYELQEQMNRWKGGDIPVDGDYRVRTAHRVRDLQMRNRGRAYRGKVDGVPGSIFCEMLGVETHPNY